MDTQDMDRLIEQHLSAEKAADTAGAVAMYVDDVEHDVVGFPQGPARGREEAQHFYDFLTRQVQTEEMKPLHSYYGEDFCVIEHLWTGTVPGSYMGIPGHGRRIAHRILHVWEFREGRISRENVWVDSGAIVAQLTADADRAAAMTSH